jgi:PiT family inorganic phosphate transporter
MRSWGGLAGGGTQVQFLALGTNFLYPLLFSPAIALVLGAMAYLLLRSLRLAPDHPTRTLHVLHFLSTGAASFARGLNDCWSRRVSISAWVSLLSH